MEGNEEIQLDVEEMNDLENGLVTLIKKEQMFVSNQGWLKSRFHFSFAEYRDFNNINFGSLRVLNDDIIHAISISTNNPVEQIKTQL